MAHSDQPAPAIPPPAVPPHRVDETKRLSFWISQIFVLLATVIGVYLASSQGFKQALAYGEVQSAKTNYYLRKSLRNEIAENIPLIKEYAARIAGGSPSARSQPINMDTFVWDCLVNSSSTLETPSELLTGSRKFYRDVADIRKKVADTTIGPLVGKEQLEAAVQAMEKEILPKFDSDLKNLGDYLQKNGIAVN